MLFKVTSKDLFEENPSLNSVPEFIGKSERMLKYIMLVYDFESPYRKIPLEARKEKCVILAGYKYETDGKRLDKNARDIVSGNNTTVNNLIKVFMELQHDPEKDMLATYDSIMVEWKELIAKKNKTEKEQALVIKIIDGFGKYAQKRKELLEVLGERGVEADKDLSRQMSTIDEMNSEPND